MKRSRARLVFVVALMVMPTARSAAQNLFEVQVFPDENATRGQTEIEFHNVLMPSGTRIGDNTIDPSTHVHLSVEVTHGWTDAFETGFFLETAPTGGDRHATLTGWHVRPKFRFGQRRRIPFHVSLSFEYALFKQLENATFSQALAVTPILERHSTVFELSINPGLEVAVKGPGAGSSPVFEPSAKVASRLTDTLWGGVEYYAETGPIRHFEPLSEQHHIVFPAIDLRMSSGWDLNVGIGRGLTGSSEDWVLKSIIGVRLRR